MNKFKAMKLDEISSRMREKRTSLKSETLGPEDIIGKKRD